MKFYGCRNNIFSIILIAAGLLLHPMTATGFTIGRPVVKGSVEHIASAEVDENHSQAEVSTTLTRVAVTLPVNLSTNSSMGINCSGSVYYFDWRDTTQLAFSNGKKPWTDLYAADLGFTYAYTWNKKWTSFLGGGITAGWEEDTDDIFSYNGFFGAHYHFGQGLNWKASFGFGTGGGIGETSGGFFRGPFGTTLGPFGSISWNEKQRNLFESGWSFKLEFPRNSEIAYILNQHWAIYCHFGIFGKTFRLADDNVVSPEGLLSASFYRVGLAVDFRPQKTVTLSLGLGGYFDGEYDIQDEEGESLRTLEVDGSFGGRFAINWSF